MKQIKKKIVVALLAFSFVIPMTATPNECVAKKKATYVYYATHSKKYHCSRNCRTLARSKKVYKVTQKNAEGKRLTKCKVCY